MLTGEPRSLIDRVWAAFWSGGLSNPLEVIEQLTYLLFLRRLDELPAQEGRRVFPEGVDPKGRPYDDLRWSRLKRLPAAERFHVMAEHVFPFLRTLGPDGSAYAHHMRDARFGVPNAALLDKAVALLDALPLHGRDTPGDLYEYMLGKLSSAGQNGQFRTPRHILRLMVELTEPTPEDVVCDPASGTCGSLVAAAEYLRAHHARALEDAARAEHFHQRMFHGFDFDPTMLRIGSMNLLLHGVDDPHVRYRDSLAQEHAGEADRYSLVLANPPFAGSIDPANTARELRASLPTKKTELLFLALVLRVLKPGGRAAVIVPEGVLSGSTQAHKRLRQRLVEEQKLEAVISLPGGVFKPYAGVSTALLLFTRTDAGGTDHVWFYDVRADGWSLDDKRVPLLPEDKLGPTPASPLTAEDPARNALPDVLRRWRLRDTTERQNARTEASFCVPRDELIAHGHDLTLNHYQQPLPEEAVHPPPRDILAELDRLEAEIHQGLRALRGMLE